MPIITLLATILAAPPAPPAPPAELGRFLAAKDPAYATSIVRQDDAEMVLDLTSQRWQGIEWKHRILLRRPAIPVVQDAAVLFITGDGPRAGDYAALAAATALSGLPVAMLFDIPNQPLWEKREDDLIAHTFEQYLATGDPTWPLLFPMTKAAIRAMDAVQKAMPHIRRFVVTGASKRGWTTWMVGVSGDKRVAGIAPMVYDNLNLPAQMRHQMTSWGGYSPMIEDYTRRGLQAKLETPQGQRLSAIVDPYYYLRNLRAPVLVVNGGNDPYWTTDAISQYWGAVATKKWIVTVPNVGHDLGGGMQAAQSVAEFARYAVGATKLPVQDWKLSVDGRNVTASMSSQGAPLAKIVVWAAPSATRRFSEAQWKPAAEMATQPPTLVAKPTVKFQIEDGVPTALFAEFHYRNNGRTYRLTSPVKVVRSTP